MNFAQRLLDAVKPHDLLCHPYYQAWNGGTLTRADLAGYASQYQHLVDDLPNLLRLALAQSNDAESRASLQRNLDEEEGRTGDAHARLWQAFAGELSAKPEAANATTREAMQRLEQLVGEGEIEALAGLWAYELQTQRVAKTKREGLCARYGVTEPKALAFFALHEELDQHHAAELLAAVERACGGDASKQARAVEAAFKSALAQWRFLDGAESQRAAA